MKQRAPIFNLLLILALFNNSNVVYTQNPVLSNVSLSSETTLIQPAYLKKGDTIAMVAPAGVIKNKEPIEKAIKILKSWGLHIVLGKHVFTNNFHFAGTDAQRVEDFQEALDNPSVKAIIAARGGYGTGRIIDAINFEAFKNHPKWIVGYSDVTVLHSHIHTLGIETMHAAMGISFLNETDDHLASIASLKSTLFGQHLEYEILSSKYNQPGDVSGQLVGGNLSLLQNLVGTDSSIDTSNKILFIEEIGEYLYHIDRMLYGLKRNGYFENCKGLIIGGFSNIKKNSTPFGMTLEELVLNITKEYDFPILFDFPAGHENKNFPLILGREIKMKVGKTRSSVKFKN